MNFENYDKYWFIWSKIAKPHPIPDPKNGHAVRVSKNRQYFDEINSENFDFTNGFNYSDAHKLESIDI